MYDKTKRIVLLCLTALAVATSLEASAVIDVRDANTQTATTYFLPVATSASASPYYRWASDDWGWTHGGIAGSSFTSATLNIGAYDVDYASGERDRISVWDSGFGWRDLGFLNGTNNAWDYGSINLMSFAFFGSLEDDINAGLKVLLDIDTTNANWAVTLSKSVLEVNGGSLPRPDPVSPVPEPETYAMLLAGLGLMGFMTRRRKDYNL
ncbi:MAG: PEP-CTERM sorting domain-containing protein [Sideroxyarcus sp.]